MQQRDVRPHFKVGTLQDGKCDRCGLEWHNDNGIHSNEAIASELARLHRLEDAILYSPSNL